MAMLAVKVSVDVGLSLTSDQRQSVYLSSTGNDSNDGLTASTPKLTLGAAVAVLNASPFNGYGKIVVSSTEASPIAADLVAIAAGDMVIESADGGSWWHDRAFTYNASGWTLIGSVYQRSISASSSIVTVPTIPGADGYPTKLTQNTTTPTTPGIGEYGWSGSVGYVRLPGDANANAHVIKWARGSACLTINGTANVVLRNARIRYSSNNSVLVTGGSAKVTMEGGDTAFASNSGVSAGGGVFTGSSCKSMRNGNDGVNISGTGAAVLYSVECAYNGDEGVSAHATTSVTAYDSYFHHNTHAGANSIENSTMNLYRCLFEYNGLSGGTAQTVAGIGYVQSCTGVVVDCISRNNANGSGFYSTSSIPPTVVNLTSGVAQGNGLADVGP